MKTKLLFIYVLCFLFSCGISAQQSQKGWFKIGKAKKTVPIATQSQNTQSAQSRSIEGWQGKKAPAQATRIFYYNNGNEKVYTHKEYYEYDAYGNVTLIEPNINERVIYEYDNKTNGKLLLSETHYVWDYPTQVWKKTQNAANFTTTLNASGIRTAVNKTGIEKATFNEKGYVTYIKENYLYSYGSQQSEMSVTWKDNFPSTISISYREEDDPYDITEISNITPMYGTENFNPYLITEDDWDSNMYDGEDNSFFFNCDATMKEGYGRSINLRIECEHEDATNTFSRTVYILQGDQKTPYYTEKRTLLDSNGSFRYTYTDHDEEYRDTLIVTCNKYGDIIRQEKIETEYNYRYSYLDIYDREYDSNGNPQKTTYTRYNNNDNPEEVWEETYEKRTEEDRNVIEITLSAPGTLESALAALDKPIYALRIIGEMNQDDYYIINQIEQISFVDLSQTTNTSIPTNFLNNKEQLVAIMLPETLKEIQNDAFRYCRSLYSINLPNSIENIGYGAFFYCQIDSLILPESLLSLGDYAFEECEKLVYVELPTKLSTLSAGALSYCKNLQKIVCRMPAPVSANVIYDSDEVFRGINHENCTVVVPAISLASYRADKSWNKFTHYETFEYTPKDWILNGHLLLSDNTRIPGSPDMEINMGGGLIVEGNSPMPIKTLKIHQGEVYDQWGDRSYTNKLPIVISRSNALSAENIELIYTCEPYQWYFVSFPFDVNPANITVDNNALYVIRYYDGAARAQYGAGSSWQDVPNGEILRAGEGYIIQFNQKVTQFTVSAVHNANKDTFFSNSSRKITLNEYNSEYAHNRSWNLIGNPYPCYFNIKSMECSAPIIVQNGRGYSAYSPVDDHYALSPMQAFFIQKPLDLENITFQPEGRQGDGAIVTKEGYTRSINSERTVYNITLGNKIYTDKTRFVITPNASIKYDFGKDASKFMSEDKEVVQLFTIENGVQYAINERPLEKGVIQLGVYIGKKGEYTFNMGENIPLEGDIILIDKQENKEIDLKNESYSFDAEAGTYADRFEIHLSIVPTDIQTETEADSPRVIPGYNKITVKADTGDDIKIYAITGQLLRQVIATQSETEIAIGNGAYIVTVKDKAFKTIVLK